MIRPYESSATAPVARSPSLTALSAWTLPDRDAFARRRTSAPGARWSVPTWQTTLATAPDQSRRRAGRRAGLTPHATRSPRPVPGRCPVAGRLPKGPMPQGLAEEPGLWEQPTQHSTRPRPCQPGGQYCPTGIRHAVSTGCSWIGFTFPGSGPVDDHSKPDKGPILSRSFGSFSLSPRRLSSHRGRRRQERRRPLGDRCQPEPV